MGGSSSLNGPGLALALLLGLLFGCAPDPDPPGTQRRDSSGVTISETIGADRVVAGVAFQLVVVLSRDQTPTTVERAGQVATDGTGRIHLIDPVSFQILAFDSSGALLGEFGRRGGGPGEFRLPSFIRVTPDGIVQITDQSKLAVVQLTAAGEPVGDLSVATVGYPHSGVVVRADTMIWLDLDESGWVLRSSTPASTVALAQVPLMSRGVVSLSCGRGTITLSSPPSVFSPNLIWDENDGRVAVASEAAYEVKLLRAGRLHGIVRRAVSEVPTTPGHVQRQYPVGLPLTVGPERCVLTADQVTERFGVARHLPVVQGLLQAPDGGVWVQRFSFPGEELRVDLFDRELRYRGTVSEIGRPVGFLANGQFVALQGPDRDGLFTVAIYRTTPPLW